MHLLEPSSLVWHLKYKFDSLILKLLSNIVIDRQHIVIIETGKKIWTKLNFIEFGRIHDQLFRTEISSENLNLPNGRNCSVLNFGQTNKK